jgi:predicted Holliday junction resolvase-like endonuclease
MGNPIDYVCFDGLSDVLDGHADSIKTIRFVDIKTGKSNLNKSQRKIRDAVEGSKVIFEIVNLDEVMKIDKTLKELETQSTEKS